MRMRFKHFLRECNAFSTTGDEPLLSVSEYYGVKPRSTVFADEEYESRAESLEGYRIVKRGDLVMNYMLAWKGAYGLSEHDGIVSPAYAVFEVDERIVDRRYLHYRSRSNDMKAAFLSRSKGIIESRLRLYPDSLLAMQIDLPDLPTQKNIAAFLDKETARIDALIEKNERLISLCEEKTRAVIDSVFSKANSLIPIKYVAHINYDTLSSGSPDDMELRYADLSRVCPRDGIDPEVMTFKDAPSRARRIVHENDVLFASVGPFSKKVLSAKKEDEGTVVSTGFFVMKAKLGHHSRFLEKILQSTHVLSEVEKGAVGAIYSAINDTTFRNIRIPAFSYEEQVKFSEDMEAQISNLSALSEKAGRMNVLLKEKRSALITAAVTGQIDIPE